MKKAQNREEKTKKLYNMNPFVRFFWALIFMITVKIAFSLLRCPVFIVSMRAISIIEIHIIIECRSEFFFRAVFLTI